MMLVQYHDQGMDHGYERPLRVASGRWSIDTVTVTATRTSGTPTRTRTQMKTMLSVQNERFTFELGPGAVLVGSPLER